MTNPNPMKGDLVCISWLDADADSGWTDHDEEADNVSECLVSCGLFVSQGPKFLTISFCHNKDADQWLSKHRIPVEWIETIEVIRRLEG